MEERKTHKVRDAIYLLLAFSVLLVTTLVYFYASCHARNSTDCYGYEIIALGVAIFLFPVLLFISRLITTSVSKLKNMRRK